jgi:glycosyltransferase involved in cell wall biosynthesis
VRTLLLINATLDRAREAEISAGRSPRKDYFELQHALSADVIDLGFLRRKLWTRILCRVIGVSAVQAVLAWFWAAGYDAIFADRESSGFALAALLKLRKRRPRLVMIGHLLSSPKKQRLFRLLHLERQVGCMVVHSSLQQRIAREHLDLRDEQIALVPYQTDNRFWKPQSTAVKQQLCSAGLEYRDYATLCAAVSELDIDVVIAAASHWSKHKGVDRYQQLPPNVRVVSHGYGELRQLYAESLFVVVPLLDVENQAGITTILEAMAMGKAVIVSHTRGQTDVVRDRRHRSRTDDTRPTQPEWARVLGADDETAEGYTGIYVRPGDVDELRRAIVYLIDHPDVACMLGANGRRFVETTMGLDQFTARMATIIEGRLTPHRHPPAPVAPAVSAH